MGESTNFSAWIFSVGLIYALHNDKLVQNILETRSTKKLLFLQLNKFYTPVKYVLSLKFWSLYFRLCEMNSGRHGINNVSSSITIVQVIF